jgi:hypothetical protein
MKEEKSGKKAHGVTGGARAGSSLLQTALYTEEVRAAYPQNYLLR